MAHLSTRIDSLFSRAESALRSGAPGDAYGILKSVKVKSLPPNLRANFAKLARRAGHPELGLRALQDFCLIRLEYRKGTYKPGDPELLEYAICLQRFGAVEEALQILERVIDKSVPEYSLYRAYCEINLWNYEEARAILERALDESIEPYLSAVIRVNLLACLAATGERASAHSLYLQLEGELSGPKHRRLFANACEIIAQVLIEEKRFDEAIKKLIEAKEILPSVNSSDGVFIRKWLAIAEALYRNSADPIHSFKSEISPDREAEAKRDADFYLLRIRFDPAIFNRLYFGTPHPRFRNRLRESYPNHPIPETHLIGMSARKLIDLSASKTHQKDVKQVSGNIRKFLLSLTKDFYRPVSLAEVYRAVFDGDKFDVYSSTIKMRQLLFRTRKWIENEHFSITIVLKDNLFKLDVGADTGILIGKNGLQTQTVDSRHLELKGLMKFYPDGFTPAEARRTLAISKSDFRALINKLLETGEATKSGAARSTIYKIT